MPRGEDLPFRIFAAAIPGNQKECFLNYLEEHIGLHKLAYHPDITSGGDSLVSLQAPTVEREHLFERRGPSWAKMTADAEDKKKIVDLVADRFGQYIHVKIGFSASEIQSAVRALRE
jgi:hypothetical protein